MRTTVFQVRMTVFQVIARLFQVKSPQKVSKSSNTLTKSSQKVSKSSNTLTKSSQKVANRYSDQQCWSNALTKSSQKVTKSSNALTISSEKVATLRRKASILIVKPCKIVTRVAQFYPQIDAFGRRWFGFLFDLSTNISACLCGSSRSGWLKFFVKTTSTPLTSCQ